MAKTFDSSLYYKIPHYRKNKQINAVYCYFIGEIRMQRFMVECHHAYSMLQYNVFVFTQYRKIIQVVQTVQHVAKKV